MPEIRPVAPTIARPKPVPPPPATRGEPAPNPRLAARRFNALWRTIGSKVTHLFRMVFANLATIATAFVVGGAVVGAAGAAGAGVAMAGVAPGAAAAVGAAAGGLAVATAGVTARGAGLRIGVFAILPDGSTKCMQANWPEWENPANLLRLKEIGGIDMAAAAQQAEREARKAAASKNAASGGRRRHTRWLYGRKQAAATAAETEAAAAAEGDGAEEGPAPGDGVPRAECFTMAKPWDTEGDREVYLEGASDGPPDGEGGDGDGDGDGDLSEESQQQTVEAARALRWCVYFFSAPAPIKPEKPQTSIRILNHHAPSCALHLP